MIMDTEKLLKLLNENRVRYIVIGATAFPVHGYARATLDIDIFIDSDLTNVKKALKALSDFGYDLTDISAEDAQHNKILIRQYVLELDLHPFVAGLTFEQAWQNKVASKIGSTKAYFASLDDLIKMKEAAGRPKDRQDLQALKRLKKRNK